LPLVSAFFTQENFTLGLQDGLGEETEGAGFFERDAIENDGLNEFAKDAVEVLRGGKGSGGCGEFLSNGLFEGDY